MAMRSGTEQMMAKRNMGGELRVALLRNGADKTPGGSVYGVLDADELARQGEATLAIDGGRWCMVTADEVWIVPGVAVDEIMPVGWLDWAY